MLLGDTDYRSRDGSHWTDFRPLRPLYGAPAWLQILYRLSAILLLPLTLITVIGIRLALPLLSRIAGKRTPAHAERLTPQQAYDQAIDEALPRCATDDVPDVSIVIPFFNRIAGIRDCLGALARQQLPASLKFEIVAVDNGSSDGTRETLALYRSVRLVDCPRRGPSAARNDGIKSARAPIIAFTDSDCVPSELWLTNLIRPFADPDVLIAGGAIHALRIDSGPAMFTQFHHILHNDKFMRGSGYFPPFFATACAAYRKSALESVGGFDEGIFMSEDADLAWRVLDLGGMIAYRPDAAVAHAHRETVRGLYNQAVGYGLASVQVIRKHHARLGVTRVINWDTLLKLAAFPFTIPWTAVFGKSPYARREKIYHAVWLSGFAIGAAKGSWRERFLFPLTVLA